MESVQPLVALATALPALLLALAAAFAGTGSREAAWRRAEAAAATATLIAAAGLAGALWSAPVAAFGLRLDVPGALIAVLAGFIGWVIIRFSHRYLAGETDERRYLQLLMLTLAAVSMVLVADHLVLLAAAWIGTSVAINRLLRFYHQRPAARLAAHKKLLSACASSIALVGAIALLGFAYGTLSLDAMLARAATGGVPPLAQAGLLLLVLTALLKCAQLPLHGWLIQVMEAPTPVSALLHAGVVNLGGFVLIRFSPLLAQSPAALTLLATVATVTVVLATLVVGTRISIKVALAWSTVAQMGFMLLQIALGLPYLALLHLVAHSLYKAHAFLGAGSVAAQQQAVRLAPPAHAGPGRWLAAACVVPAVVIGAATLAGLLDSPAEWLACAVLGFALVPLVAAGRAGAAAAVAVAWFAGHALMASMPEPLGFHSPVALVVAVAAALAGLFAVQAAIIVQPESPLARRLYPWAYGGFYVDELVSRRLLARWPVPDVSRPASPDIDTLAEVRG